MPNAQNPTTVTPFLRVLGLLTVGGLAILGVMSAVTGNFQHVNTSTLTVTSTAQMADVNFANGSGTSMSLDGSVQSSQYLLSTNATGTILYVATTGSDSNTGTVSAPFQTISHALDVISGGTFGKAVTIHVADGVYHESLRLPEITSNVKDTTYGQSVVYIVGDQANPDAVTIIGQTSQSTNVIGAVNIKTVYIIDGVQVMHQTASGAVGINAEGGETTLIVRNFDTMNVATGIRARNQGILSIENTGRVNKIYASSTGISYLNKGYIKNDSSLYISGTSFAISAAGWGSYMMQGFNATSVSMVNSAAGTACIQQSGGAQYFDNQNTQTRLCQNASQGAIRLINGWGTAVIGSGQTWTLDNTTRIAQMSSAAYLVEFGNTNWILTGGTASSVTMDASSQWLNNGNNVGGATFTSTGGGIFLGTDVRYPLVPTSTSQVNLGTLALPYNNGFFGGYVSSSQLYVNGKQVLPNLSASTISFGNAALLAGQCTSTVTSVPGATTAMSVVSSPQTYPGDGAEWESYISSAGNVTTKVCALVGLTPTASVYSIRVIQ